MKKHIIALFMSVALVSFAQKGETMPAINGVTLEGKNVTLPIKNGKYSIIGMAYHRGAEEELKKWLNPLYYAFVKKPTGKKTFDVSEIYDVNFSFIPMISGFKKIADDFKASTQKEFWPYIVDTEKTDIKTIKKQLGVKDDRIPYFYVLDKNGKIIEVQSGEYSEKKVSALEDAMDE